jgi:protocatechuate 3,4-dioxygenase beta subunit
VIDQDNNPVFMATVTLKQTDGKGITTLSGSTSQNGIYSFDNLTPATYEVMANHEDYTSTDSSKTTITVENSNHPCSLKLNHKGYTVSGRVLVHDTKEPVEGFEICLFLSRRQYSYNIIHYATSDAEGKFTFTGIHRGFYRLAEEDRTANPQHEYTSYTKNFGDVLRVNVYDKDVTNIIFPVFKKVPLSGRVFNEQKEPVEGASINTYAYANQPVKSDSNGYYTFPTLNIKKMNLVQYTSVHASHPEHGYGESKRFQYQSGDTFETIDIYLKKG